MRGQLRLSFDTSAVNALADCPDCAALLAGVRSGYFTRLTFLSVSEPLATSDPARRKKLFEILNTLRLNGECLEAHQWILTELVRNHRKFGSSRWDSLDLRFAECEDGIARRDFSDRDSEDERKSAVETDAEFSGVFENARPAFEKAFADGTDRPANADSLLAHLNGVGGVYWSMAANLYHRAVGVLPTEELVRAFMDDCPPFKALMLGLVHAQFELAGIREKPAKRKKRVGRNDLFCSIYLPYCDLYVTDDEEQRRCLTEIALTAKLPVGILSFADFSDRLMPLNLLKIGA